MITLAGNPLGIVSLFLFMPVMGIFGSIWKVVKGAVGGILGGGQKNTSPSADFSTLYQQSQQQVYNLQSQLAQKSKTDMMPILLMGGMALVAIFLFKKK